MKKINILGINISILEKQDVLKKIKQYLKDGKQHYIVTPNPEIVLTATKDEELFYILNKADLALPDGVGLFFAGLVMGKKIFRVTGADLTKSLLQYAENNNIKIAILNWRDGLSRAGDIKGALKDKYPELNFAIEDVDREWSMQFYQNINAFQPKIVFVTLGAPWQEKFIAENLKKMPFMSLAIGVGGAFDFLTGKIKRSPQWLRVLGLEWVWRLIKQPQRWHRIYNAVIFFPLKFIRWKFIRPFLYRPNVACMLYRRERGRYKIFIVERQSEKNHWQIPQGGTDGEDLELSGVRELTEEMGNSKFMAVKTIPDVYKYLFHNRISRAGVLSKNIEGYRGQKQGLFIAEFTGDDKDIKINYWDHTAWRWADSQSLVDEVHPLRKEGTKIFLKKFNKTLELDN